MQTKRLIKLLFPLRNPLAGVCLVALLSGSAQAYDGGNDLLNSKLYNKQVRTNALSIYAQGGLSWASGLWYENVNARNSFKVAPALGVGLDYTIRPWVRVGAEYMWAKHRREQQPNSLDATSMPIKAYGNYVLNAHNAHLGVGLNLMELWSQRQAQWMNVWIGTGAGYMMAKSNEYGIHFNTSVTENGTSKPIEGGNVSIGNGSNTTVSGNVSSTNTPESFNCLYVPVSLHIEFDVARQVSVGLKGGVNLAFDSKELAPKSLAFGMLTLRYNFVPGEAKVMKRHYDRRMAAMAESVAEALRKADAEKARADKAEGDLRNVIKENAELQRKLDDVQKVVTKEKKPQHTVLFDNNSSYFSEEQGAALREFARKHRGKKLSLVAEASQPGTKEYNQEISERRLERVVKALVKEGFKEKELRPSIAIGSKRGIDSARARRVTITVE